MSNNKGHTYNITLDLQSSAASKQVLKELQTAFANSNEDMDALNDTVKAIIKNTKDVEAAEKQYNKVVEKSLADRAEQIDKLNAEKVAIIANKDLTEEQRKEALRLRDIQIDLLDNERKSIEAKRDELALTIKNAKAEQEREKKLAKARQKEAELLEKLNKTFKSNFTENSKMFKLTNQMVKAQEKLNNLLGKESKLRKAGAKLAAAGGKVGGAALKAGGALAVAGIAAAGAAAGAVAGSANDLAEKERALAALKSGVTSGEVERVYISTGADYTTIVAAINKLSRKFKGDDLVNATITEVRNPGFGDVLMANNSALNSSQFMSVIDQIKKGSGNADLSEAMSSSTQSRAVTRGDLSQAEYIQAYAALQATGLEGEKIDRIIADIARKGGNFIENFNETDLAKYVRGQQKNQVKGVKLEVIDPNKKVEKPEAEAMAEQLRRLELLKNKFLIKMIPILEVVIKELDKFLNPQMIDLIAQGLVDVIKTVFPILGRVMKALEPILPDLLKAVRWIAELATNIVEKIITPIIEKFVEVLKGVFSWFGDDAEEKKENRKNEETLTKMIDEEKDPIKRANLKRAQSERRGYGPKYAQGGLALSPSICGEAGPELIIPLDNSRSGRASQIVNNFNTNQNFNMSANQTTPLAFAQAVGQNRFVRRTAC